MNLEFYYRIGLIRKGENFPSLRDAFDVPMYQLNGFDHPLMLIITSEFPDTLVPAKWGIAPELDEYGNPFEIDNLDNYYKKQLGYTLNAQAEKAFKYKLYYDSIFERRCVIPVDGFYEPHTLPNRTKKKEKVPFVFEYEDKSPISLAGIYNVLHREDSDEAIVTFTIFTREANDLFKEVHNVPNKEGKHRMPLILNDDVIDDWLNEEISSSYLEDLLLTEPSKEIIARPVTRDIYKRVDSNYEGVDNFHDYHTDPQGLRFDFNGYKPHFFGEQNDLFNS